MTVLSRRGLKLPRFLLLGSAAIVAVIVCEWLFLSQTGSEAPPPGRPPVASAADAAAPSVTRPAIESYAEIAARPLFIPGRHPQPPDKTPSGPPPARPNVTVLGIVLTGNTHYALVRHGNPPKLESLGEGQSVDGWQIQSVAGDRITLRSGTETADYLLGGGTAAANGTPARAPNAAPLNQSWGGSPDP
jgi:hypothetical protein